MTFLAWLGMNCGNIASILGLVVSVGGFAITIVQIKRARTAVQAAKEAIEKLKGIETQAAIVGDCSAAIAHMEEIGRLHREQSWTKLPERYTSVKRLLVSVKGYDGYINKAQQQELISAIAQFVGLEDEVEKVIASKTKTTSDRLNKIVSQQMDRVQEILVSVKSNLRT